MSAQELPKPVEVVLERGIGVREFRTWPDGWAWLDTFTPWEAEPELVRELFKHKAELLQVQDELWDALCADGCPFDDYILAAAMIDGRLVIVAWLHKEDFETENQL
jgi:hypothetical protein